MNFDKHCNYLLKEAIFSNGIKKTWSSDSGMGNWDGEVRVHKDPVTGKYSDISREKLKANPELYKNDPLFYVETNYDFDFTHDAGDDMTPPDTTIDQINLNNLRIYQEDPNTGNYDVDISAELEKTDPELFQAISYSVEEKIAEIEYERI